MTSEKTLQINMRINKAEGMKKLNQNHPTLPSFKHIPSCLS